VHRPRRRTLLLVASTPSPSAASPSTRTATVPKGWRSLRYFLSPPRKY
jgi:hypothetical protein